MQPRPHHRPPTRRASPVRAAALLALSVLAVAACGDDEDASARRAAAGPNGTLAGDLPQPEDATGSVTGMPGQPGPGTVPLATAGGGIVQADTTADPDALATDAPVGTDAAAPPPPILVMPSPTPIEAPRLSAGTPVPPPDPVTVPTPATPAPAAPASPQREIVELDPGALQGATETTTLEVPADRAGDDAGPG